MHKTVFKKQERRFTDQQPWQHQQGTPPCPILMAGLSVWTLSKKIGETEKACSPYFFLRTLVPRSF
jgi:hypothetical protein